MAMTTTSGSCWICAGPATITNWTAIGDWLTVEDCACGGFFVLATLWDQRMLRMLTPERQDLAERLRTWRGRGDEAWLATRSRDGAGGPIVIASEQPGRPDA